MAAFFPLWSAVSRSKNATHSSRPILFVASVIVDRPHHGQSTWSRHVDEGPVVGARGQGPWRAPGQGPPSGGTAELAGPVSGARSPRRRVIRTSGRARRP